jgi:hypothetical protein
MTSIRKTGNRFTHEVGRGYQRASRNGGRFDEPPLNRWIIICPPLAIGLFLATVEILR